MHAEGDVFDPVPATQVSNHQSHGSQGSFFLWKFLVERAAHHQFDDALAAQSLHRPGVNAFAIAHHRGAVRQRENLIQAMADVDDADSLRLEIANDGEELFHFPVRQDRRGFVEHENARLLRERLGDLDALLPGDGQITARGFGIDADVDPAEQSLRLTMFVGAGNESNTRPLAPEKNIFAGRKARHEVEFLVNDGDAQPPRVLGRGDVNRTAVNPDCAGVGPQGAAKHLDERALARAVFPEQREHFAREEIEPPVLDRTHAGKRFLDPDHFQQRCAGRRHLSDASFSASALR